MRNSGAFTKGGAAPCRALGLALLAIWLTANVIAAAAPVTMAVESGAQSPGIRPAGDSRRGKELYGASCVVCHGSEARGGVGPRLSGNPVLKDERAFQKIVHEGRHVMPPLKDTLSDQQLADILAWLTTLP